MKSTDLEGNSETDEGQDQLVKEESRVESDSDVPSTMNGKGIDSIAKNTDKTSCEPEYKIDIGLHTEDDNKDVPDVPILEEKKDLDIDNLTNTKEEQFMKVGRRSSRLQGKRTRLTETSSDDENHGVDDDVLDCEETKIKTPRKRGRPPKKGGGQTTSKSEEDKLSSKQQKGSSKGKKFQKGNDSASKIPKEFSSGSFVVSKTDFHASTTPPIWRIDGKALLQKYTNFEKDGQILYKNTSTYSGWILNNRDQYFPATVEIQSQNRKEIIVLFKREQIVDDDSD